MFIAYRVEFMLFTFHVALDIRIISLLLSVVRM
jgi:hypothetical protein